jgi:hypothetical protein
MGLVRTVTTMYDSVSVGSYPADTQLALGYVDGHYPDAAAVQQRFPHATVVTVTTSTAGNPNAQVYDCEKGDGNAVQAVQWVQGKLARKQRPCVYCSRIGTAGYGWPWVLAALKAAKISTADVDFIIADATGEAHLVPGSVATQWGQGGNGAYDISLTNGVWPNQPAPAPTPPTQPKETAVYLGNDGTTQYEFYEGGTKKAIPDGPDFDALNKILPNAGLLTAEFVASKPDAPSA